MVLRAVSNSLVIFLSTLSLRRATKGSLHGGPVGIFLSTLSLRRATLVHITVDYCTNISIHALLTESDLETVQCYFADWFISIHALLTESDPMTERMVAGFEISIHALLAESDQWEGMKSLSEVEFLSTLSLRRATKRLCRGSLSD